MNRITEKTWIPLGGALTILGVLIGGIVWLTEVYAKVSLIPSIQAKQEVYTENLAEIRTDIALIKKSIEHIEKKGK